MICCNPERSTVTLGPSDAIGSLAIKLGEAAHIRAARPGPRFDDNMTDQQRAEPENQAFVLAVLLPVIAAPRGDVWANEVRHARRHNDFVAEGQGLDCAVLVIRPFPILRVTEFEGRIFLVEVQDIGDNDTTGRTGEGMLPHVLMTNLGARDDLRMARDANDRVANCHTEKFNYLKGQSSVARWTETASREFTRSLWPDDG